MSENKKQKNKKVVAFVLPEEVKKLAAIVDKASTRKFAEEIEALESS